MCGTGGEVGECKWICDYTSALEASLNVRFAFFALGFSSPGLCQYEEIPGKEVTHYLLWSSEEEERDSALLWPYPSRWSPALHVHHLELSSSFLLRAGRTSSLTTRLLYSPVLLR